LKKEAKITEAVLRVRHNWSCDFFHDNSRSNLLPQESKAGLAVGKLRSHAVKDVSELAKEIVRAWKTVVDKEKQAAGTASKGAAKPAAGTRSHIFFPRVSLMISPSLTESGPPLI
jgi:transcription elongation factor S-II